MTDSRGGGYPSAGRQERRGSRRRFRDKLRSSPLNCVSTVVRPCRLRPITAQDLATKGKTS